MWSKTPIAGGFRQASDSDISQSHGHHSPLSEHFVAESPVSPRQRRRGRSSCTYVEIHPLYRRLWPPLCLLVAILLGRGLGAQHPSVFHFEGDDEVPGWLAFILACETAWSPSECVFKSTNFSSSGRQVFLFDEPANISLPESVGLHCWEVVAQKT